MDVPRLVVVEAPVEVDFDADSRRSETYVPSKANDEQSNLQTITEGELINLSEKDAPSNKKSEADKDPASGVDGPEDTLAETLLTEQTEKFDQRGSEPIELEKNEQRIGTDGNADVSEVKYQAEEMGSSQANDSIADAINMGSPKNGSAVNLDLK